MADDINLPNLVSHLNVDLSGVSGAVADASRQGSSMGAALGRGVNRELDNLLRHLPQVTIDGDSTELDRDLVRIHRELSQLDSQRIGVDIAIPDALRQIDRLQTQLQRLGDEHPDINVQASTRQASAQLDALLASARRVDEVDPTIHVDVDEDRTRRLEGILGRIGSMAGSLGGVAASFGTVSAAVGAAVPLAAGLVSTLAQVAPAAGLAVTGLAAVQLASGTVKLAAVGVKDALGAALDPAKADKFNESLKKLSPEARKFATAVHDAAPELQKLQRSVQDQVFKGWSTQLQQAAKVVLPTLTFALGESAAALNKMGTGVLGAAKNLGKSGVLDQALGSASEGLNNLSGVPGVVVTALGQIAAAAGPSFETLTAAAGKAAGGIGDKLSKAFASGAMQDAIERAIDLIGQLASVAGNVIKIVAGVFNAVPPGGGGLLTVLEDVTATIAKLVNSPAVQSGLAALMDVMGTLGSTIAPLLGQALLAIAPVLTALGPPVQRLIAALGSALSPVIAALGPVLEACASAVGGLLDALSPILPVIGQLVGALLPVLVPLFEALQQVFAAVAPTISVLASILGATLTPILQALPAFLQPLLDAFTQLAVQEGPLLTDLLTQLQPSLVQLGVAFGQVLAAIGPLLPTIVMLSNQLFVAIAPYLPQLISAFAQLATIMSTQVAWTLQTLVVPALRILGALLTGDLPGAATAASTAMHGLQTAMQTVWNLVTAYVMQKINEAITYVKGMPGRAGAALSGLAEQLSGQASRAGTQLMAQISAKVSGAVTTVRGMPGRASAALSALSSSLSGQASRAGASMTAAISAKISSAVSLVRGLPGRARSALGSLGGVLAAAGRSLIQGLISGIQSKIGAVQSTLANLTSKLPDWKGPKAKDAKILTPAGKLLIEGLIKGITGTTAKLQSTLASITKDLPANVKSGYGKTLKAATAALEKDVAKRDAVIKKLATAQKNLDDLTSARTKAAGSITSGILDAADITSATNPAKSVTSITVGLQKALQQAKDFQANIAKLKKQGLRSDLLQEIADAGVEGGATTAAALAKATPAELKRINDLQAQLTKSATATGNTVGDALYSAGINAAKGLVAGLKSQEKAIEAQMKKIANSMLTTVKKVHKTHSPSRAFADIGRMDGEGLRGGLLAMTAHVRTAAQRMAGAALDITRGGLSLNLPSGPQVATAYAGAERGGGDQHNTFNLYGSDASPSGIVRELSWQSLVSRR